MEKTVIDKLIAGNTANINAAYLNTNKASLDYNCLMLANQVSNDAFYSIDIIIKHFVKYIPPNKLIKQLFANAQNQHYLAGSKQAKVGNQHGLFGIGKYLSMNPCQAYDFFLVLLNMLATQYKSSSQTSLVEDKARVLALMLSGIYAFSDLGFGQEYKQDLIAEVDKILS